MNITLNLTAPQAAALAALFNRWSGSPNRWSGSPNRWSGSPNRWSGSPNRWSGSPNRWSGYSNRRAFLAAGMTGNGIF